MRPPPYSLAGLGIVLAALVAAAAAAPAPGEASPLPPGEVTLLDGPFRRAMLLNADYLLSISPDRLLHNTRKYAGLEPKGALYGGWESAGIAGHTLGHYLTALSQQYAATGDTRFRQRIDYIVSEMALCQRAYGDGYIGALPPLELGTLRDFKRGVIEPSGPHTFKGGAWVPWYTEHKVLNGLKDAWILGGNPEARVVALRLADWVDDLTAGLSDAQLQRMLSVEHGGMMDVLAQLYALTGNPRYLAAARRFRHAAIMDPLLAGRDELAGRHANTQIPKVIGEARLYEATGEPQGRTIAEVFWHMVVRHHSYVIGGNSDDEYFFEEADTPRHVDAATAETCNTYNMLKLTEHLMDWQPRVELADFYEKALYNHILASQDPKRGMFAYFLSLEPGLFKTYSTPFDSFWCCVGTGMENHTKYASAIFLQGTDALYVNLFIPAALHWEAEGFSLSLETDYPRSGLVRLVIHQGPSRPVALRIRCPGWSPAPLTFEVNGQAQAERGTPGTYAEIRRVWKQGDSVTFAVPLSVRAEPLPGDPRRMAFVYGPAVLAGLLGPGPSGGAPAYAEDNRVNLRAAPVSVPRLVVGSRPAAACIERISEDALVFRADGLEHPKGLELRPIWEISTERYSVYWELMTADAWEHRDTPAVINQ